MKIKNAKYMNVEKTIIDVEIEHPTYGWIPYTFDIANDKSDIGSEIAKYLKTATVGAFVEIAKTPEEILSEWKQDRQNKVDSIVVSYNNVEYQGDETSQTRISRAIVGLNALNSQTGIDNVINWVALDNSTHQLKITDLSTILLLAGQEQSILWSEGRPQ